MIIDSQNEFADAVSVASGAGTALIGNVIDLGVAGNLGNAGKALFLVILTDTEIVTAGAAGTIKFQLVSDAQAAIATDGSASVHLETSDFVTDDAAVNAAQLNAGGKIIAVALPQEGVVYERYLGVLAVIGTTAVTEGAINAFLTFDPPAWKALPDAAN